VQLPILRWMHAVREQAIGPHGVPEKIPIDKSGANMAAIQSARDDSGVDIALRQSRSMNNITEQDHRAIKRIVRPHAHCP
jgi:putative transposase